LVLLGDRNVQNFFDLITGLKATHPDLRIIVTGSGDEETILKALVAGAEATSMRLPRLLNLCMLSES